MATHSSVLAWRIPGTGEPGGLPSMGSQSRTRLKQLSSSSSSSMDARGNWGQNQHLTDSGVQNLSTKPYRAKTPQGSSCHMDCIPERSSQSPVGSASFLQADICSPSLSLLYEVGIRCVRKVFKYWRILEASACHTLKCQRILFVYSDKIFLLER